MRPGGRRGVRIRLPGCGSPHPVADQSAGTLTDEDGAYRIAVPSPGAYAVKAARAGFTRDSLTVTVAPRAKRAGGLHPAGIPALPGPCFDGRGNPIAGC